MPMPSAVALLSGGLDSGVATCLWRRGGGAVRMCLTFDYGQRSASREREWARRLALRHDLPWRAIALPWMAEAASAAGSALVDRAVALPSGSVSAPGDRASAARVWVPARNVVFLAAAAAFAEALEADCVIAGFNREEAATFPDNSQPFMSSMNAVLEFGTRTAVEVRSPTLAMDKREIVAEARRLGLGPKDFWSCYEDGAEPCGACESCARSRRAWGEVS